MRVTHVPNISDLHPALNGEGLLLSGYAATLDLDRVGDVFDGKALKDALADYMRNPVVLYHHDMTKPPIGKVLEADYRERKGIYVKAFLPRPLAGSWQEGIWHSVKSGMMRAFSVGGAWLRRAAGGYNRIVRADIREISLASVPVNRMTVADSVESVQHVKALSDGTYVPILDAWEDRRRELVKQMDLVSLQLEVLRLSCL